MEETLPLPAFLSSLLFSILATNLGLYGFSYDSKEISKALATAFNASSFLGLLDLNIKVSMTLLFLNYKVNHFF